MIPCLRFAIHIIVLGWSLSVGKGHVFRPGACPQIEVLENFNFTKFSGKWYTVEKSRTSTSCMEYDFQERPNGSRLVKERGRLFGVRLFDLNDVSQVGEIYMEDETNQSKMTVKFPFTNMNPFTPSNLWIVASDYDRYAAIFSCRRFLFGHFQSAMILSRNRTLDRPIINKMRSRFEFYGIDKDDLSVVDHDDCPSDSFIDKNKDSEFSFNQNSSVIIWPSSFGNFSTNDTET